MKSRLTLTFQSLAALVGFEAQTPAPLATGPAKATLVLGVSKLPRVPDPGPYDGKRPMATLLLQFKTAAAMDAWIEATDLGHCATAHRHTERKTVDLLADPGDQ